MTNEEKLKFMEMLRKQHEAQRAAQVMEGILLTRRRATIHQIYRDMGFEVFQDNRLAKAPFIDVPWKFVEVEKDFYERD